MIRGVVCLTYHLFRGESPEAEPAVGFRTRLPLEEAHFSMFLHVFLAVSRFIKNNEEGHPRLFSRFLGAFRSGVTKQKK